MANYELTTISKGTIKTVDSFIKNFNAIGANMKALSVSAYKFLTDENKDVKIEFQKRVMDELKMSKTTLSFLKTAGYLYTLDERFGEFAYTNVIYFKKALDYFTKKNEVEPTEEVITTMFKDIAKYHDSRINENFVDSLVELSQKELKNLIDKYVSRETSEEVEEVEESEDTTEDTTEEVEESEANESLEQAKFYSIIDEDMNTIMDCLNEINDKMSKVEIMKRVTTIKEILINLD